MTDLFGIDIAGIVADAIGEAGNLRPAILTKSISGTRATDNLAGGNRPTAPTHTCQAFEQKSQEKQEATSIQAAGMFVSILGATIDPPTEPETNDQITIDGTTYSIEEIVNVDPARAIYKCRVEA